MSDGKQALRSFVADQVFGSFSKARIRLLFLSAWALALMVPVPELTVGSFAVISAALIGLALRTRRDAAH